MNSTTLTSAQLRRAADIKDRIAKLEKQLKLLLPPPVEPVTPKKKMKASTRRKMAAIMRARWATWNKAK